MVDNSQRFSVGHQAIKGQQSLQGRLTLTTLSAVPSGRNHSGSDSQR